MDKIEESKIIDYLYGELPENERQEIEKAIKNDVSLKAELDSLSHLKSVMTNVEDKEVIPPSFVFDSDEQSIILFYQTDFFKKVMSIAAGLTLILVSTYFTGFQISNSNEGFTIGFQKSNSDINKDEMRAMMQEVLAANNQKTDNKITAIESKLTRKIDNSNTLNSNAIQEVLAANTGESKKIMKAYVKQLNDENLNMIQGFFLASAEQQQQNLKSVMADFTSFYQSQRENDLQMIETGINTIQNDNIENQYQTDVVLASLMDIVQVKNK